MRTTSERRLPGFMLWQSFAALHFSDALWRDFHHADLAHAVTQHQEQQRTFGV